jgi:hypothetical protein
MYRFRPSKYALKAYAYDTYPAICKEAKCIMHNIMNNLDEEVAQFPE